MAKRKAQTGIACPFPTTFLSISVAECYTSLTINSSEPINQFTNHLAEANMV